MTDFERLRQDMANKLSNDPEKIRLLGHSITQAQVLAKGKPYKTDVYLDVVTEFVNESITSTHELIRIKRSTLFTGM